MRSKNLFYFIPSNFYAPEPTKNIYGILEVKLFIKKTVLAAIIPHCLTISILGKSISIFEIVIVTVSIQGIISFSLLNVNSIEFLHPRYSPITLKICVRDNYQND